MSTPWRELAEAIQDRLEGIEDIGRVHRRTRYLKDRASWLDAGSFTDSAGRNVLRAWFIEPAGAMVSTDLTGFGNEVTGQHTIGMRVVGVQPVMETIDGEGSYDEMEALAWAVKRSLDAYQPNELPGFEGLLMTTAATVVGVEMRVLPTGELSWVATVERQFVCLESDFALEVA